MHQVGFIYKKKKSSFKLSSDTPFRDQILKTNSYILEEFIIHFVI